ncbi:hypothetical protein [Paraglaciecola sp. 2405UD69-4]|uniref:hypothetical protein n=1 Tax=Paraglaciecola sp. 2405UD69-4 TaxID=3391836 RepID=UPI0039C9F6E2
MLLTHNIGRQFQCIKRLKVGTYLWPFAILGSLFLSSAYGAEFSGKLDTQVRLDERSNQDIRYQYRLRAYPSLLFGDANVWSLNGFLATGDAFSSSHNTFNDSGNSDLYLRRLFVRYEQAQGKTEFGIIPTYKGRVSSTGLSKDGWIKGLRHVQNFAQGQFELVLGELENTQASDAIHIGNHLNFFELEYSGKVYSDLSFEVSAEHVLGDGFLSGELRYQSDHHVIYATELIHNLATNSAKLVASATVSINVLKQDLDVFTYYSYVSDRFGPRAELTEDFLATGHGVALEVESELQFVPLDWFVKLEAYKGNSRAQLGLKYSTTF